VKWVQFPLHPDTPVDGQSLEELFRGRQIDIEAAHAHMQGLMRAEGLPYGRRTRTYNSRLAQELGKWADAEWPGLAIHDAMFKAYFVDDLNIADESVLMDIVRSVGLPPDDATRVLRERRWRGAVDADWEKSRAYGVTAVPTFVSGGYGVVGAQPYTTLERFLDQAGARRKDVPNPA
jgi:predicted DsbA family dithiol-disulfide isomerase